MHSQGKQWTCGLQHQYMYHRTLRRGANDRTLWSRVEATQGIPTIPRRLHSVTVDSPTFLDRSNDIFQDWHVIAELENVSKISACEHWTVCGNKEFAFLPPRQSPSQLTCTPAFRQWHLTPSRLQPEKPQQWKCSHSSVSGPSSPPFLRPFWHALGIGRQPFPLTKE